MTSAYSDRSEEPVVENATEYLSSMITGDRPHPNHSYVLGTKITSVESGRITIEWRPPAPLLNPAGTVHGGFIAGVLDMAAGLAAASKRDHFVHHMTLEIQIDFLAPARSETTYTAIGEAIRIGKSSSLADAKIEADGVTIARCRGTFLPNRRWQAADGSISTTTKDAHE